MSQNQAEVIEFLKTELRKIFPTSGLLIRPRTIIGETNIHITYTNAASSADCSNGILENDPAYMAFAIWSDRDGTFYIEKPTQHRAVLSRIGVKRFVTIKGKTEMACAIKLVEWMRKHSGPILSLGR